MKNKIVVVIPTASDSVDEELIMRKCGADCKVDVVRNKDGRSLTEIYDEKLNEYGKDGECVIVFMHDDVAVSTRGWGQKIIELFNSSNYGIIGVAGSEEINSGMTWWANKGRLHGKVMHSKEGSCWVSEFGENEKDVYDVCVVDGLFLAVNPSILKCGFDLNVKGFDFYDVSFCLDNFLQGVRICVTNLVRVVHGSVGELKPSWYENRDAMIEKYKNNTPICVK